MNTTQITSTGIAVTLAVVIALGLLFFGPSLFGVLSPSTATTATTTDQLSLTGDAASTTATASMNDDLSTPAPIPSQLPTTLSVSDTVVGTGAEAVAGKTVTVNYVGMLPNGQVFDASASHGQAFSFSLGGGQVIKGWDQGIVGMKVGGKRRLIIPADLAYGSQGAGDAIPPNATLIFDVELLGVQ